MISYIFCDFVSLLGPGGAPGGPFPCLGMPEGAWVAQGEKRGPQVVARYWQGAGKVLARYWQGIDKVLARYRKVLARYWQGTARYWQGTARFYDFLFFCDFI